MVSEVGCATVLPGGRAERAGDGGDRGTPLGAPSAVLHRGSILGGLQDGVKSGATKVLPHRADETHTAKQTVRSRSLGRPTSYSQRVAAVPFVVGLGAVIVLATVFGRWYWARRVGRWADEHDLKLLEFRGARLHEGPRAFLRSESQFAFRVVVEDEGGVVRTGRLSFGGSLSIWPTGGPEIRWDSGSSTLRD